MTMTWTVLMFFTFCEFGIYRWFNC